MHDDRLRRTVRLGDLFSPNELFTTLQEPLRLRCRSAFAAGRDEALERLQRAGMNAPSSVYNPPEPFRGTAYTDDDTPTEAYREHWQAFYQDPVVRQAQADARRRLNPNDKLL